MEENVFLINGADTFVQITELCGFNEVVFWLLVSVCLRYKRYVR